MQQRSSVIKWGPDKGKSRQTKTKPEVEPSRAKKAQLKFKVGDKVRIKIEDSELKSCVPGLLYWLMDNQYVGTIDEVVKEAGYPYYIEGHDFKESELELYAETNIYRIRVPEIEAVQLDGNNLGKALEFAKDIFQRQSNFENTPYLILKTYKGEENVFPGDWIIRHSNGMYSILNAKDFYELYVKVL